MFFVRCLTHHCFCGSHKSLLTFNDPFSHTLPHQPKSQEIQCKSFAHTVWLRCALTLGFIDSPCLSFHLSQVTFSKIPRAPFFIVFAPALAECGCLFHLAQRHTCTPNNTEPGSRTWHPLVNKNFFFCCRVYVCIHMYRELLSQVRKKICTP